MSDRDAVLLISGMDSFSVVLLISGAVFFGAQFIAHWYERRSR